MNRKEFDRNLISIGQRYEECINLKNHLKNINQEEVMISLTLMIKGKQEGFSQGCIQKRDLLDWINSYVEERDKSINNKKYKFQQKKRRYLLSQLQEIFPHNKIAYSTLYTTCLKGSSCQSLQLQEGSKYHNLELKPSHVKELKPANIQELRPYEVMLSIIINQLQIIELRKQLIPLIPIYIPITQTNLTLEQLKDYLLLCVNVNNLSRVKGQSIILGLNGFGGKSDCLQYQFYAQTKKDKKDKMQGQDEQEQQSDDEDESILRIEEVMQRLNKRVDKFGNEWLIDK